MEKDLLYCLSLLMDLRLEESYYNYLIKLIGLHKHIYEKLMFEDFWTRITKIYYIKENKKTN